MRVFLDANVLFSASNAAGPIAQLVFRLTQGGTAVTNDLAIEEARRNLAVLRPNWVDLFELLADRLEVAPTTLMALPVRLPERDVPVLSTAIAAGCTYFATGDRRDFGALYGKDILGTRVIPLVQLAKLLREGE